MCFVIDKASFGRAMAEAEKRLDEPVEDWAIEIYSEFRLSPDKTMAGITIIEARLVVFSKDISRYTEVTIE